MSIPIYNSLMMKIPIEDEMAVNERIKKIISYVVGKETELSRLFTEADVFRSTFGVLFYKEYADIGNAPQFMEIYKASGFHENTTEFYVKLAHVKLLLLKIGHFNIQACDRNFRFFR